jgi:hypothetical protein
MKPDRACRAHDGNGSVDDCICNASVTVGSPSVDLLLCDLPVETGSPSSPFGARTVLYAAEHGALRIVFDKLTALSPDEPHGPPFIRLEIRADSTRALVAVEASGGTARPSAACASALSDLRASVDATDPQQRKFPAADLATYRQLCAALGRYVWKAGTLVRAR